MTGRIFDIQRFSIQDGPGIRTTVFLKGCPLHCLWCHNPESISPNPLLSYMPEKCIGCGDCVKPCRESALLLSKTRDGSVRALLDRARCTGCGACAPPCASKALEMVGRDASVDEVLGVVLRDREYYTASGGGITLSGGEPMFQPEFTEALLAASRRAGLHTAVETSGFAEWKAFERIAPLVDLFLFDYKETDSQLHQSFTGKPREPIIANLRALHDAGARILLRCPMIPEFNARKEHLDGIVKTARELPRLLGVELLPYHRLGRSKLQRFGLPTRMPEKVAPPDRETVDRWRRHVKDGGARLVGVVSSPCCAPRKLYRRLPLVAGGPGFLHLGPRPAPHSGPQPAPHLGPRPALNLGPQPAPSPEPHTRPAPETAPHLGPQPAPRLADERNA